MDLDPVTFLLEIVNFVVLLWLLTRFLFRPVQAALDARTQLAAKQAGDIAAREADLQRQAEDLARARAELQAHRSAAEAALGEEIAAKRKDLLNALQKDLDAERTKARARFAQEQASGARDAEREAQRHASTFVAGYLTRLASPALETAIVELFLSDLQTQAPPAHQALTDGGEPVRHVTVATAFDAAPAVRQRLEDAIAAAAGGRPAFEWRQEPALIAGVRVETTAHRLEASLQRGVAAFAEPVQEAVA